MKYTSEMLMKNMGLQVGDRVKIKGRIFIVILESEDIKQLKTCEKDAYIYVQNLLNREFEILKKVGDLKCHNFNCETCPISILCSMNDRFSNEVGGNLYERLEVAKSMFYIEEEIYNIIKTRLDKEVFINEK